MTRSFNRLINRWTIESCDLILFVIDAVEGITSVDELLARHLVSILKECHEKNKGPLSSQQQKTGEGERRGLDYKYQHLSPPPIILVLNKSEGIHAASQCLADAYDLQLGHPELVSAKTTQPGPQCISISQRAATEAWLEGLARRYGRGVRPSLAHMQITDNVLLPWSLEKKQVADECQEKEEQLSQEEAMMIDAEQRASPAAEKTTTAADVLLLRCSSNAGPC
ncbi:hypothetical protein ACSSS7_003224 [Eimeria intestinalis]